MEVGSPAPQVPRFLHASHADAELEAVLTAITSGSSLSALRTGRLPALPALLPVPLMLAPSLLLTSISWRAGRGGGEPKPGLNLLLAARRRRRHHLADEIFHIGMLDHFYMGYFWYTKKIKGEKHL